MSEPTYRIAQRLHARRAEVGLYSYGEHLKPFNKRCSLIDAIEESADMLVYLLNIAQESRHLLMDLMINSVRLREAGHKDAADGLDKMIVGMGGKEALAQYDEILGGGTVAEDATVDPRDEALRVATEALEYCRKEFWGMSMREATDSWLGHVANQAEDKTKQAIAAIRAELAAAKNLLARIHRDGGHHTEAVGFAQSVADADLKVSEWLLAAEERTALAAHDAALLRRLAAESAPGERADIAPWLLAEADRIEKEAVNG